MKKVIEVDGRKVFVRVLPARMARGADTWKKRGGVNGPTTGGAGLTVPVAFKRFA